MCQVEFDLKILLWANHSIHATSILDIKIIYDEDLNLQSKNFDRMRI